MRRLKRSAIKFRAGYRTFFAFCSYLVSLLDVRPTVRQRIDGDVGLSGARRVAVFTHYDKNGHVRPYVRYYLDALRESGFAIVFVTTGRRIDAQALPWLKQSCALIIRRRNVGRDFGSFRDGLRAIGDRTNLDQLLLANDSVYGPFGDLGVVLHEMDDSADVWGITDSWERRYHLQSFFMVFAPRAFNSDAFGTFWRRVRNVRSKRWIIFRYEVGLTRSLLKAGLRCKALYPSRVAAQALVQDVRENNLLTNRRLSKPERAYREQLFGLVSAGIPINTIHFFWDYLITEMGCPFMKRELLRYNPGGVPFLQYWESVVRKNGDYDIDLIIEDLEINMRNRSV